MIALWSYRFTVARGWHWVRERSCKDSEAPQWLRVFKEVEPTVEFRLSCKEPK